jgi:hypothetical protein
MTAADRVPAFQHSLIKGGNMALTGLMLKQGILLFWALWLTVAWLANTCDGLKACHVLGKGWKFASGNYALMVEATQKYHTPLWLNATLFFGVILWQGGAALLFWSAFSAFQGLYRPGDHLLYPAFLVSLALWAAFIIIDEIFLAYETEDTHLRVFTAQAISLLVLVLLPEGG